MIRAHEAFLYLARDAHESGVRNLWLGLRRPVRNEESGEQKRVVMGQSLPNSPPAPNNPPRFEVKALFKALGVMDALRHSAGGLRLTDIAEAAQLNKTTALRILQTLQRAGWVSRDPRTRRFKLPLGYRTYRIGYAQLCAGQPFSDAVTRSLVQGAANSSIELLISDNQYSAEKAIENAERMIEQKVDFAIEFQLHSQVAPVLADMFAKARIPTLAIDIPQPGALYFGANNYAAGLMAGEALGRWARKKWRSTATRLLLLDSSVAGPTPHARIVGMLRGVKKELPPYMSETLQILHRDAERTGTEAGAYRVITKALSQLSRREHLLIGTINDACALGALRAVHEASRERFTAIVSQNFSPDPRISAELQENASPLVGSVAFFPEKYGARIIAVVVRWLNKEQVPPSIYTDHLLVTKNNIGEFLPMTDASVIGKSTQDSLEHGNP